MKETVAECWIPKIQYLHNKRCNLVKRMDFTQNDLQSAADFVIDVPFETTQLIKPQSKDGESETRTNEASNFDEEK